MISRKLWIFNRNQGGYSLIEIAVTIVIVSIITIGATVANAQVIKQTSRNNDYTTASRQTLNALYWISRDTQMAQEIQPDGGGSGFPLILTWREWDNTSHTVNYSLENNKLMRSYSINDGTPRVLLVAEYINDEAQMTNCASDNGVLILTVTGSVGVGAEITDVTEVRNITSRPNL